MSDRLPHAREHAGIFQRLALLALACMLAFTTLTSALTIAELHDHDCSGDDCAICLVLEQAQAMLVSAAEPMAPGAVCGTAAFAVFAVLAVRSLMLAASTPVQLGVKLII